MDHYIPPFELTSEIFEISSEIMENLGRLSDINDLEKLPRLRKISRLKSIHSSLAIEQNTGARGLRSIMESFLMPLMYSIPSRDDVQKIIITRETVINKSEPKYILK